MKGKVVIGEKINLLTPLFIEGRNKWGEIIYLCKCDCGKETIVTSRSLRSGHKKSCGCLRGEGWHKDITYKSWISAKQRCTNKNDSHFRLYGERGISMCKEWLDSYDNFRKDMGERPSKKHTLDRIDVNGDYEPSNCRWATAKEQGNNRRNNRFINVGENKMTIANFCRKYNLNVSNVYYWLRLGFTSEQILSKSNK